MKSVSDLTIGLVKEYDQRPPRKKGSLPRSCVVGFPIILVEGQLFEAYFSESDNSVQIREAQHIRCHWRGSPAWIFHATIDVVTLDAFDEFCATRFEETKRLLKQMMRAHDQVKACIKAGSSEPLEVQSSPRGIVGFPPVLIMHARNSRFRQVEKDKTRSVDAKKGSSAKSHSRTTRRPSPKE